MIPNKVRFGLDSQNLPARAVNVSPEALAQSGGGRCVNVDTLQSSWSSGICYDFCNPFATGRDMRCNNSANWARSRELGYDTIHCRCMPRG